MLQKTDNLRITAKKLVAQHEIQRATYCAIFMRIFKALLEEGEPWNPEESEVLVNMAWATDAHGKPNSMTQTEFKEALFECADM